MHWSLMAGFVVQGHTWHHQKCPLLLSAGIGKRSSFPRSVWAQGSWCSRWPRLCVNRCTCTDSGPSAGTPTRAKSCPTITTTRRAPSSPPSGRSRTSCPPSSNCSSRCMQTASSNSASRTAPELRGQGQRSEVRALGRSGSLMDACRDCSGCYFWNYPHSVIDN